MISQPQAYGRIADGAELDASAEMEGLGDRYVPARGASMVAGAKRVEDSVLVKG